MIRKSILETIDQHLRDGTATTTRESVSLSLGEVVGRVARDIRRQKPDPSTVVSVIPIEQVAAFVDGDLDPARVDAVCRAVMIDNGVLAELIAAVRAKQTPLDRLAQVPDALTERLLATHPVELISSKDIARMIQEPVVESRRLRMRIMLPAIAAIALAAFFYFNQAPVVETDSAVAQVIVEAPSPEFVRSTGLDASAVGSPSEIRDPLNKSESAPEIKTVVSEVSPEISDTMPRSKQDPPKSAPTASNATIPEVPTESAPDTLDSPDAGPKVEKDIQPGPKWMAMKWTDVAGLVSTHSSTTAAASDVRPSLSTAQRPENDQSEDIPPKLKSESESESEQQPEPPKYRRVMVNSEFNLDRPVTVQSLRLSRGVVSIAAAGELNPDADNVVTGEMIFDEDTIVAVMPSVDDASIRLDLRQGAIVIRNVVELSTIELVRGEKSLGIIVCEEESRVLIHAIADGIEVRLQNAALQTDEGWFVNESVRLAPGGASEINSSSLVSTSWINTNPTTLDRLTLGQIGESTDLSSSIDSQISRLAASNRLTDFQSSELSKLIQMRLSLAGDHAFSFAASRLGAVRRAIVQWVALLPKTDPRYDPVWSSIETQVTPVGFRSDIDEWMQLIRTGGQPRPSQLARMLDGLKSDEPIMRGLSDAMLRLYIPNPPAMNPSGTAEEMLEVAEEYQQRLANQR